MPQIARLEQMLKNWEDYAFLRKYGAIAEIELGSHKEGCHLFKREIENEIDPGLRQALLDAGVDPEKFDPHRFLSNDPKVMAELGPRYLIPIELLAWSAQSRKVFEPSPDLQALLNATDLDGLQWSDVMLPYESFGLVLDQPIMDVEHGRSYDFILVTHGTGELPEAAGQQVDGIRFHLIAREIEGHQLPQLHRQRILDAASKRQWEKLRKRVSEGKKLVGNGRQTSFVVRRDLVGDQPVTKSVKDLLENGLHEQCRCGQPHPEWDDAVRLVIGFCVYLNTLPTKSPHRGEWRRPTNKEVGTTTRCITSQAEICTVASTVTLTAEEREVFSREGSVERESTGRILTTRARRGHWRRPPGKGNDPTHPKTVHVRPTIVRRDLLPPGAVMPGSETRLN